MSQVHTGPPYTDKHTTGSVRRFPVFHEFGPSTGLTSRDFFRGPKSSKFSAKLLVVSGLPHPPRSRPILQFTDSLFWGYHEWIRGNRGFGRSDVGRGKPEVGLEPAQFDIGYEFLLTLSIVPSGWYQMLFERVSASTAGLGHVRGVEGVSSSPDRRRYCERPAFGLGGAGVEAQMPAARVGALGMSPSVTGVHAKRCFRTPRSSSATSRGGSNTRTSIRCSK